MNKWFNSLSYKQRKRLKIFNRTNGRCYYCGLQLVFEYKLSTPSKFVFTIDHLEAKVNGGKGISKNTVPCCQQCNSSKGSYSLEEWRKIKGIELFWFELEEIL
jgi:5-methylcytosine-specific restriction endonuclease McrA